jgi:peptidoglycan/xylan/chitin deacetylase (PgdA/CDA1 family)/TolA-binding protein
MPEPAHRKQIIFLMLFFPILLFFWGCGFNRSIFHKNFHARVYDDFVLVNTTAGDTLASLSEKYLKSPNNGWLIAEFNHVTKVVPGQQLIIPLSSFNRGGLKKYGYQTVPILVYHNFSKTRAEKMTLSEDDFDTQMKYLKQNNYHVISLDQLMDFLDYKAPLPEKSIVITFDDAWRSAYDIAVPILIKYGFTATFFVYTDFIGGGKALSWKDINDLSKTGFDIQCQTKTHRNLSIPKKNESFKAYFNAIEMEVTYPKKLFKKMLNKDCRYLAYPYGETNNIVIAILKKYGYRGAFTLGREPNPFFIDKYKINRSVIYGNDDMERFKACVSVFRTIDKVPKKASKTVVENRPIFKTDYFLKKAGAYENVDKLQRALFYLKIAGTLSPKDKEIAGKLSRLKSTIKIKSNASFKKGKKFYRQNKFEDARNQFLTALRYDPNFEPALYYLKNRLIPKTYISYTPGKDDSLKGISKKFYKEPDLDFLIAYFNNLKIQSKPESGKTLQLPILPSEVTLKKIDIHQEIISTKHLLKKKKYQAAINVSDKILKIDHSNQTAIDSKNKAYYQIAMEMMRDKKYFEAIDTLKKISPGDKGVDKAIQNAIQKELLTAERLLKKKKYTESIHLSEKILRYDGSNETAPKIISAAHCRRVNALLSRKKYTEVSKALDQADPSDICTKKLRVALKLSMKKEAEAHYIRGVKHFLNEELQGAINEWEITLKLDPTHDKAKKNIKNARNLLEKLKKVK